MSGAFGAAHFLVSDARARVLCGFVRRHERIWPRSSVLVPQAHVPLAVLPQEVRVQCEHDVAEERAAREESAVKEEVECDHVHGDRQDEKRRKRHAAHDDKYDRGREDDGVYVRNVCGVREHLDERERLIGVIEFAGRFAHHAGRTGDWQRENKAKDHFENDIDCFHDDIR